MRTAVGVGSAASGREDWQEQVDFVREAERLGVDDCWSAEAWGQDALTPLAYLAATTERIRLGTGILQVSARAPSMAAMSAMTMSTLSDGRFVLGLGVSGPQVVEGLTGQPFARPLERLREYVDILRLAFAGEKLTYAGNQYVLPLPGGQGKALRLSQPADDRIPIYLATLGPKSLQMTGAIADGWVGTSFVPESAEALLDRSRPEPTGPVAGLADVDIQAGGPSASATSATRISWPRTGPAPPSRSVPWARRRPTSTTRPTGEPGSRRPGSRFSASGSRAGVMRPSPPCQTTWSPRPICSAATTMCEPGSGPTATRASTPSAWPRPVPASTSAWPPSAGSWTWADVEAEAPASTD